MPTMTSQAIEREADLGRLQDRVREVRAQLHRIRQVLDAEIRNYPTPIPRCDAQFNHLFEQRSRVYRALERADARAGHDFARADCVRLLQDFVASPPYSEDKAEDELRSALRVELSRLRM